MSEKIACDCLNCLYLADWEIFPRRHDPALAVRLCNEHRSAAIELKGPKQELYSAATAVVRLSLSE